MRDYDNDSPLKGAAYAARQTAPPSVDLIYQLKAQRKQYADYIIKIDTFLDLLEKHPDFIKMFDLARQLV